MDIETLKKITFISCPFDLLVDEHLDAVLHERINIEIGLNGTILDRFKIPSFKRIAAILKKHNLKCTVHAPFIDLSLGAIDSLVRKATVKRLKRAIDIASVLEAKSMVFHTGFEPKHYFEQESAWLKNSYSSLEALLNHAKKYDLKLNLENVYEYTPQIHEAIFSKFPKDQLGLCLDLGHQNVFAKSDMSQWLKSIGSRIGQLHLHDNRGKWDDHLAIGSGKVDFHSIFQFLEKKKITPLLTIEAHKKEDVIPSLKGLALILTNYPAFHSRLLKAIL